jgi:hypothetical protein
MPPGFVAGFLLLRATWKSKSSSGVQKASHNRSVCASGLAAPRPPQWLGHSATRPSYAGEHSHGKPPPHFVRPANAPHLPIRAAKPSPTAGTLDKAGITC